MGNNPDIGVDELGNIVFNNVKTKEMLMTDWPFKSFYHTREGLNVIRLKCISNKPKNTK